jgi:HJR/Mrr/RecB family endonuclease
MARYKKSNEPDVVRLAFSLLIVLFLFYYFDRDLFMSFLYKYILPFTVLCALAYFIYLHISKRETEKDNARIQSRFKQINESGIDSTISLFIDRFGKEGKGKCFKYRGYNFDWKRLSEFRNELIEKEINISSDDFSDISLIIKHYIDRKEADFLSSSINTPSELTISHFSDLNKEGSDLEHLIVRLYGAMGYSSKRVGGPGDQGADVIANKNGDSVLVQAKSYNNPVDNKAVQEAYTGQKFHNCNRSVVITTSTFTDGARDLAKANGVELIDGELLSRKLHEHLGENWVV